LLGQGTLPEAAERGDVTAITAFVGVGVDLNEPGPVCLAVGCQDVVWMLEVVWEEM